MTTANEQRTRDGYALFMAANKDSDGDWDETSPLGQALHKDVEWWDYDESPARMVAKKKKPVLDHLRELKRQTSTCNLLVAQEAGGWVHTLDFSEVTEEREARHSGTAPHVCGDMFRFDQSGLVIEVRYCAIEIPLVTGP